MYMWIFLDAEDLLGGVGKALPTSINLEEDGPEEVEPYHELEDDIADKVKRTKKRMRSTGGQFGTGSGVENKEGGDAMTPAKFLEQVGKAVTSLAGSGGTGGARASALEKMQSEQV